MTRLSFLSRIFRFRSRRSASQKTANPETVSRQQHSSSSEPTQVRPGPAVTASNLATPHYNHGVNSRSSPPPESAIPIRVVSYATSTAQPRSVSAGPVPLSVSITPTIPSPRIVQSPLTTSFPARTSPTITDPAETRKSIRVSRSLPPLPPLPLDRRDVHLHGNVHQGGSLPVPPSESQWVAPTQIWGEHGPQPQNLRPATNGSPGQLPPTHVRRRVTFQAPPRTRTWQQTPPPPPETRRPSEESLASSCSTLVPNTHFRTTPVSQAAPAPDKAVRSPESQSFTVAAAETRTMANEELLAGCGSQNKSKSDALAPLLLQSPETLPPSRIPGSEKARRHASLFPGTPHHYHQQVQRSAKATRFSLPATPRARNAARTSFLPLPSSPGTGLGTGSTTKREKRQSMWSREANKPETQDMLRMMASTGLSV